MKSYSQIWIINLRKRYKRSLLIAIGMILSLSLIVCIGILRNSIQRTQYEQVVRIHGTAHGWYDSIEYSKVDMLKSNKEVKRLGVSAIEGTLNYKNLSVVITAADKGYFSMHDKNLILGHYPMHTGEIILQQSLLDKMNLKMELDQKINMRVKTQNQNKYIQREFTIVGIYEDPPESKMFLKASAFTNLEDLNLFYDMKSIKYNTDVQVYGSSGKVRNQLEVIAKECGINNFKSNPILNVLNSENESDKPLLLISLLIILISSTVVYNIYNISIVERIREFGILSAIGATSKQLKKIVIKEVIAILLVSIPLGILAGVGGAFMFKGIVSTDHVDVYISPFAIGVGVMSVIIFTFISTVLPIHNASTISPIDVITGNKYFVKKEKYKLTFISKVVGSIFGICGKMAYQNVWRNKKRFVLMVLSISIAISMFIVSGYLVRNRETLAIKQELVFSDIVMTSERSSTAKETNDYYSQEVISQIKGMKGITDVHAIQSTKNINIIIPKNKFTNDYRKEHLAVYPSIQMKSPDNNSYSIRTQAWGYDSFKLESYKKYIKEGKIDTTNMSKYPEVLIMNTYGSNNGNKFKDISTLKVGDLIKLGIPYYASGVLQYKEKQFKIAGIIDLMVTDDVGILTNTIEVFMHQNSFKDFTGIKGYKSVRINIQNNNNAKEIANELYPFTRELKYGDVQTFTNEKSRNDEYAKNLANILYAISAAIALICSLNIVNTINTNLLVRSNEFGMLIAVGTTDKQLKTIVMFEGVFYSVISSFIGTAIGLIAQRVVMSRIGGIIFNLVPWSNIIIVWIVTFLICTISCYIPMKKMSNIAPVNLINNTN